MRDVLELTYKGFEVNKYNPQYTMFKFVNNENEEYIWSVTGSPKALLGFDAIENDKVVISAEIKGNSLKRVKIIKK